MEKDQLISNWIEQQEDKEKIERIITLTETLDVPAHSTKEEAWDLLVSKINDQKGDNERILAPTTPKSTSNQWMYWVAGLAAIFLIGFFGIKKAPHSITIQSQPSSILAHRLPDESQVVLNAGSSITYLENGWKKNRIISLKGEAYFDVKKGETFKVLTETGETVVIGTSFNIKERDGVFEVGCSSGKVLVKSKYSQTFLDKGQQAFLENGILYAKLINTDEVGAWRKGEFFFRQAQLETVIRELERQFEIEVSLSPDIKDRIYNGYFNKANLDEALKLVFIPMGLEYEVNGKQVTIK